MQNRKPVAKSLKRRQRKVGRASGFHGMELVHRRITPIHWFSRPARRRCLHFTMYRQEQTQWCWTATATSVAQYYDAASTWTQCSLVNAELGRSDCCSAPSSNDCNHPWTLKTALTRVGHLASVTGSSISFTDVQAEIDNGRPLGVRIGWSGGGGHFNVLSCYTWRRRPSLHSVQVEDPWYGTSVWDYDAFRTAYQGSGSWTNSYKTQE